MPKHSVIISSYNRPVFVRQAIASVASQTNPDFEALIADDGSNAETLHAISEATKGDGRFQLLPCQYPVTGDDRSGCVTRYAARINDALKVVTGKIVHYLADDDYYDPGRLAAFDDLFMNASYVVGYGRLIYVDKEGKKVGDRFPYGTWAVGGLTIPFSLVDHNQVAHRTEALKVVPQWPTKAQDDFALDGHFFADLAKSWPFWPIDRVVAYKRFHGLNLQWTRGSTTSRRE